MDDLVTWLRGQLDDDERVARATTALSSGTWRIDARGEMRDSDGVGVVHASARIAPADLDHIARHDPARVLAEVDAKRRIMAIHHPKKFEGMGGLPQICDGCGYGGICDDPITEDINDCPILRLLALPYADRPGYRQEWAPSASA